MGMSTGGNKGGVQSEINVTPLIDVLLVLLIIFLVVMPIMMKMEALQIPRKITENEAPDPKAMLLTVKVKAGGDLVLIENGKKSPFPTRAELLTNLRNRLEVGSQSGNDKVVFVDFSRRLPWGDAVTTMDSIRSLAADLNHDAVKVALKIKPRKGDPDADADAESDDDVDDDSTP